MPDPLETPLDETPLTREELEYEVSKQVGDKIGQELNDFLDNPLLANKVVETIDKIEKEKKPKRVMKAKSELKKGDAVIYDEAAHVVVSFKDNKALLLGIAGYVEIDISEGGQGDEEVPVIEVSEAENDFTDKVHELRVSAVKLARNLKALLGHDYILDSANQLNPKADIGEIKANIQLAYRHTEDCVSRIWKLLDAKDGNVNIK